MNQFHSVRIEQTYSHCQPYKLALPERNPTPVAMRPPNALTISLCGRKVLRRTDPATAIEAEKMAIRVALSAGLYLISVASGKPSARTHQKQR